MSDLFSPSLDPARRSGTSTDEARPQYPTRASLRGRTPAAPESPDPRGLAVRHLPKAAAGLVALVGVLLVTFGTLQGTVFKPSPITKASLPDPPSQPIVVSKAGLMGLDGPRVQISASGTPDKPIFLGIGRASDITAYLANVRHLSITGENGQGVLTTQAGGGEASLPDPAAADVWVLSQRGRGSASLNWPNVAGQWVVVAATDGTAPAPARLTVTWSGAKTRSSSATFIAVGAVLLVCGLVLLAMLVSRSRLENET